MKKESSVPLHVLFLEDNPSDVILMLRQLQRDGFAPEWKVVCTRHDYEEQLQTDYDVILANYTLPDFDALRALELLQERDLDIPFIVVTGSIGEETAARCIKQGASDYLLKDRWERLGAAVNRALHEKKLRDEKNAILAALRESEEKYRHLFEMESDAILLIENSTGQILEANTAASELYGYNREELLRKKKTDLSAEPDETRKTIETQTARIPIRYHKKSDGTVFPVEISARFLTWWGRDMHIAAVRDISKRIKAEEALYRERDLSERIVVTSPVGITVVNRDGQIVFANEQAEKVLGLSQDEIIQRSYNTPSWHITDYNGLPFPDEELPFARVIATGKPVYDVRHAIEWPDGKRALLSINAAPLIDETGRPSGMVSAIEDITQRVEAEKALQRALRAYRVISECNQALVRIADEQELLDEVCRVIVEVGGFSMAWVGFAEMDEAKTVRPVAWAGAEAGYLSAIQISWDENSEFGNGPTGAAIRTGTPCTAHNIMTLASYAPWRNEAGRRGYVSSIALPLLTEGQAFGTLNIYASEQDAFDTEEIGMLVELAGDLAYGIGALQAQAERSKAESALQESEERYRKLFDNSLSGIALHQIVTDEQGTPVDYVFLEVNPAFEKLTGLAPAHIIGKRAIEVLPGIEKEPFISIYGQVALTGEPIRFEQFSASLGRTYEIAAFSPRIGQFATTFTDITERKKVEAAIAKRVEEIRLLHEAGRQLTSTLDPQAVYRTICDVVSSVMDCDSLFISIYDAESEMIHCAFAWHEGRLLDAGQLPPIPLEPEGHGIQSTVIRTGRPDVIGDFQERVKSTQTHYLVSSDGLAEEATELPEDDNVTRSALVAPLKLEKQVVGVIQVLSYHPDAYNEDDLRFLEALAAQAAVARKNALLYQQAQVEIAERERAEAAEREHRTLAEALRDTIAILASVGDTAVLMARILENVGRVVPHDAANLMLVEGHSVRIDYLRNYPPYLEAQLKNYSRPLGHLPILEKMVETGEPVLVPDVVQEPSYIPITGGWALSYIGAPIRVYGMVIGFLNLHSTTPGFFTPIHAERLQAFADQVALALENAQLYETLRHHADDLKMRIDQRTAELRQAKEHVEAILNNSSDAILVLHADGCIQQVNPAFRNLFGHDSDMIFGENLVSYAEPSYAPQLAQALQSVIEHRRAERIEFVARRRDKPRSFNVEMTLSLITMGDRASDVVCILRDITQRKRAEEELRRALEKEKELGELKSRFVSVASHEFRTPLTTILSSASWLEVAGNRITPAKQLSHLQKIQTAAKSMTELIDDVLTFSKTHTGLIFAPSPTDLGALFRDIIEDFKPLVGSKHTLLFKKTGRYSKAILDEKLLRLIATNLLSNAIKYSPDGGAIRIELACKKREIVLKVMDNGLGIPEKDRPHIFGAFHRAANVSTIPGTGLGLSIAREAVLIWGGTITFDTQVDAGTTFTVILPVQPLKEHS